MPFTTLTVIRPEPLGDANAASSWLAMVRDDDQQIASELGGALRLINRAVHAHRGAVLDPNLADVAAEHALAVRIGFGSGEELADGGFTEAFDVPRSARRRRGEALPPQERVAATLGGAGRIPACELLILRARADLDAGRLREAALQLQVAVAALRAEREAFMAPGQEEDLAAVAARVEAVRAAADEALRREPGTESAAVVSETVALAERILRRQRALG